MVTMENEDNYIDYIDKLDKEVIDVWCRGLEDLANNEELYIAEGYDYSELEEAYKDYPS